MDRLSVSLSLSMGALLGKPADGYFTGNHLVYVKEGSGVKL
jgi:hypothetical protein